MYTISVESAYLRADLFNRETVEETREFLDVVGDSASEHARSRILISVHVSSPLFAAGRAGFPASLLKISEDPAHKIALVGDTNELGMSLDYLAILGRQQGLNVRNFKDEASVLDWFNGQDPDR